MSIFNFFNKKMLNSIKSRIILKKVTEKLFIKLRMNIFKYNKKLLNKLNMDFQTFINYSILKKLNLNLFKKIKN